MPFKIIQNDITKMDVGAIVNAANTSLLPGGGVCGAIFAAAGYDELTNECRKIGHCDTGGAVITKGFNLPAEYIIHTPGPVYTDGHHNEEKLLYSCYKSSLELAERKRLKSIAFSLISSGIYGYPKAEALKVATNAVMDFLEHSDMDVYLVVYDKSAFETASKLFFDVEKYINEKMILPDMSRRRAKDPGASLDFKLAGIESAGMLTSALPEQSKQSRLDEIIVRMDVSFSERLLQLIDESGMTDAQVYKRANIDRKLFSKIRSNREYKPSKVTAAAFAIALRLNMDTTRDLIGKAGYSLTHSNKFDIIIEYFIENKNYNIYEINEVLFKFDQPLIGA